MVPAGYLLKRTVPPPGWLLPSTSHVTEVCSVAHCVNDNVVEPQDSWKHNGFGLANSPKVLWELARESGAALSGSKLFFYSAYERELESDGWEFDSSQWQPLSRAVSSELPNEVAVPGPEVSLTLLGYDVVVFGDYLEHSPLSCNSIARDVSVNKYCLFDSFSEALAAVDAGRFGGGCEEGRYKIFSVALVASEDN